MLKNKTVFITGASSGIGLATAETFAAAGCKLLLCGRRINLLEKLTTKLKKKYKTEIHSFQLDVSDPKSVTKVLTALPKKWQKIDVLINNAGLAAGLDSFQEGNINDWEEMINTNVKGLLYITKAILPNMIKRNSGHIINLGSIAGHHVYPKGAVYCATKFAVNALSQGLRMDLFGTKIRVTSIDPGAVETNFSLVRFKGDKKRAQDVYKGMDPLKPSDIAETIFWCASRPSHVNVSELIILPTDQASATMVSRKKRGY